MTSLNTMIIPHCFIFNCEFFSFQRNGVCVPLARWLCHPPGGLYHLALTEHRCPSCAGVPRARTAEHPVDHGAGLLSVLQLPLYFVSIGRFNFFGADFCWRNFLLLSSTIKKCCGQPNLAHRVAFFVFEGAARLAYLGHYVWTEDNYALSLFW